MSTWSCTGFRSALEHALRGAKGKRTAELAWHEHLLGCSECQELLQSEEALEELLASLPEPRLPDDLTRRVLLRLERERTAGARLDDLLDSSPLPAAPAGLGERVLSSLRAERQEQRLDDLLDRAPAPKVPAALASSVLAGLEAERHEAPRTTLRLLRGRRPWVSLAAAAAVVVAVGAGLLWRGDGAEGVVVDEAILANLEVLENWDALMSDDLDLYLASLDPVDWTLLELEAEQDETSEEEGG